MGDGGASNTSPCIAEIRARSPIFNGCLPSASGDVRDRSNPRTGLACVDPKACPCMSTRHAHQQAYRHAGCERKKRISACGTGR